MASLAGQEDALELLLDGARYGDLEDVVAAVEQARCSPDAADESGRTALHMAAANGHAEVISYLLEHGANPEAANAEGNTALHWACLNGQEQAARLLMEKGASASALNASCRTPVDEALGRPFQDRVLGLINAFGRATDELDAADDPEAAGDMEDAGDARDAAMADAAPDADPALRVYDKYKHSDAG